MRRASSASSCSQLLDMARLLSSSWRGGGCRRWSSSPHPLDPSAAPPPPLRHFPLDAAGGRQQGVTPASPRLPLVTAAAGKGAGPPSPGPSSEPPPSQHHKAPRPHQHQQQQHKDYHVISSGWQVRRTSIEHYPLETQQRMRSERRGGGSGSKAGRTQAPPGARQPSQPQHPQQLSAVGGVAALEVPAEVTDPAKQLLAALNWEAASGYSNGLGRSGERFSAWTAGRLLGLSAQLPPVAPPPQQQQGEGVPAPSSSAGEASSQVQPAASWTLADTCSSLAQELARYDSMDVVGRVVLTQRARLAAEELLHAAVEQYKQQQQQQGQQQGQQPSRVAERYGSSTHGGAGPPQPAVPLAAIPLEGQQQQQQQPQPLSQPEQERQPLLPAQPAPSQEALALAADPDAAAALAHEEETLNGNSPLGLGTAPSGAVLEDMAAEPRVSGEESAGEEGRPGGARRRRVVAPATLGFRQSFAQAAAAFSEAAGEPGVLSLVGGEQRTAEWHRLREKRLTASAFSKALGFFSGDRVGLWEEKVGLRPPFAGNQATAWGTRSEPLALEDYSLSTGQAVEGCMFQVKHDDMAHGWLGASPDGLIGGLSIAPEGGKAPAPPPGMWGAGLLTGPGPGILEVKCPYNKGRPEGAVPPQHAIWYYMPQVQGLMDIFDREWCNLFVWTPAGGSGLYHVVRDRRYWAACFVVLADFWWSHVVPARQARERQGQPAPVRPDQLEHYRPQEIIQATAQLKAWSKEMAVAAPATFFPPRPRA